MSFSWECKYCGRPTTVTDPHHHQERRRLKVYYLENDDVFQILIYAISCPNPECKKLSLSAFLYNMGQGSEEYGFEKDELFDCWDLLPEPRGLPQPEYIPDALKNDYYEACGIRELSPKASASLARRCLQGMIRDFWKVKDKPNLKQEIDAIQENVDPGLWKAIDGIREMGNIGAHMEKDVNLIVDIEPDEAEQLIKLIELLFKEWYVARHDREERIKGVINTSDDKAEQKESNKGTDKK